MKMNKLPIPATTWMNLTKIMWNERSHQKKKKKEAIKAQKST